MASEHHDGGIGQNAELPHVVIVGAGFGGLEAGKVLGEMPVRVTIVDRTNHHLFQPLLYQVACAGLAATEIASPIRHIFRRYPRVRVLLDEVRGVDLEAREILLEGQRLGYDYLILATGMRTSYFGRDEWAQYAIGLKNVDEAIEIRRRILVAFEEAERLADTEHRRKLMTFVVVGGGPTGVELAGAISELARHVLARDFRSINPHSARVVLVEAAPRILGTFPPDLSAKAQEQLEALGVEVRVNAPVTDVGPKGVRLGNGEGLLIPTSTILWAAGVRATLLTRTLGVPLDRLGRVLVEPDLSIPGHPEAFVIGDAAAFVHQTGKALPGVSPVAMQQGRFAAGAIGHSLRNKERGTFHYKDKGSLATIGRAAAVADFGRIKLSGFLAWLSWLLVHIFFLVGFKNRLTVMLEWAWSYFSYARGARLITGSRRHAGPQAIRVIAPPSPPPPEERHPFIDLQLSRRERAEMSRMAAKAHTYYLARWDIWLGDQADNEELRAALKAQWQERSQGNEEPAIVDGFSVWLDREGKVHFCLVENAMASIFEDAELAAAFLPYLESQLISADDPRVPERPPG